MPRCRASVPVLQVNSADVHCRVRCVTVLLCAVSVSVCEVSWCESFIIQQQKNLWLFVSGFSRLKWQQQSFTRKGQEAVSTCRFGHLAHQHSCKTHGADEQGKPCKRPWIRAAHHNSSTTTTITTITTAITTTTATTRAACAATQQVSALCTLFGFVIK